MTSPSLESYVLLQQHPHMTCEHKNQKQLTRQISNPVIYLGLLVQNKLTKKKKKTINYTLPTKFDLRKNLPTPLIVSSSHDEPYQDLYVQ